MLRSFLKKAELIFTTSMAVNDLGALIYFISTKSIDKFLITFYTIRLFFYVLAVLFFIINKLNVYYFPALSGIPDRIYWRLVFFAYLSLRVIFLNQFIKNSPLFSFVSYGFLVSVIGTIMMAVQSRPWDINKRKQEEKNIYFFIGPRRANLSKEEYEVIKPSLKERGKIIHQKPLLVRVIFVILSLITGAVISTFASNLVDFFEKNGFINLNNLFPPY